MLRRGHASTRAQLQAQETPAGPKNAAPIIPLETAKSPGTADHTILWIDQNPHDMELAILVLARLAPQFAVVAINHEEGLEEVVASSDFSLVVLGDTPQGAPAQSFLPMSRQAAQADHPNKIRATVRLHLPDVPILLFSETSSEQGLHYLRSGFDDFLPKSSRSFLELPQFLTKALRSGQQRRLQHDREARLSRLLEYTGVGAFRATIEGRIVDANAAFLQIFELRDLDHAQRCDFTRLFRPSRDSPGDAPVRTVKEVKIDDQPRRLRFTQVVLLTPDGGLTIDGLVEDIGFEKAPASSLTPRKIIVTDDPEPPREAETTVHTIEARRTQEPSPNSPGARKTDAASSAPVVSLGCVLHTVIEQLSVPLDRIQAQVQIGALPNVPGDPAQLTVLFRNLLENAIRFRSKRPLLIEVNARNTEDSVILSVQDNGIGMSSPTLHRILSPSSLGMPELDREGGSPLGLAISRRIVEHHRGEFWAESTLGRGTIFHVSFPRINDVAWLQAPLAPRARHALKPQAVEVELST